MSINFKWNVILTSKCNYSWKFNCKFQNFFFFDIFFDINFFFQSENILISNNGFNQIKIANCYFNDILSYPPFSHSSIWKFKPIIPYLAPEYFLPPYQVNVSCDVYSFGDPVSH